MIGAGGMLIAQLTKGSDDALIFAVPLTLAACAAIGVVNGVAVALAKLPPFIATLSSGILFYGVALGLTAGSAQQPVAPALQRFMNAAWLGVPVPVLFIIVFSTAACVPEPERGGTQALRDRWQGPRNAAQFGLPIAALTIAVYAIAAYAREYRYPPGGLLGERDP